MDRRDFIKKATMAATGATVVSPVSAMLNTVTNEGMAFLLQKIHADGDVAPKREERHQFMNFIR